MKIPKRVFFSGMELWQIIPSFDARVKTAPGMGAVMRGRHRFKYKITHQVSFFLPITALTILAIATAMPSDCRLCSRQK